MNMHWKLVDEDGGWLDCVPSFGFDEANRKKIEDHRKIRHREELEYVSSELKKRGIEGFEIDESRSALGFGVANLVYKTSANRTGATIYFDTPRNQYYVKKITLLISGVYFVGGNEIPQFRHQYAYDFKEHMPSKKFFDTIKNRLKEIEEFRAKHEKLRSSIDQTCELLEKRLKELGHGFKEVGHTRGIASIDTGADDVDISMKIIDGNRIGIELSIVVDVEHIDVLVDVIVDLGKRQTIRTKYS